MNTIVAVLFDLDGTLIDNTKQILKSFQLSFEELLTDYPGDGKILAKSIATIANENNLDETKLKKIYLKHIQKQEKQRIAEGMLEFVIALRERGVKTGIVTSKLQESANMVFEDLRIRHHFDVIVTSKDTLKHKPHPDPLLLACEKLSIQPSEKVWYLGDAITDMQAAQVANLREIGVTWGVHGERIKEYGDTIVSSKEELTELLNEI